MAIWLGSAGGISLGRTRTERTYTTIQPSGVDVSAKRFGFEDSDHGLITGDQVWIRRVDASGEPVAAALDFVTSSGWVDGVQHSDGRWFVNADALGSLRLFGTWREAVAGSKSAAFALQTPSSSYRVSYAVESSNDRCLAQTVSWVLNTDREVADFSSLGDGFRQQMGTMVSGSGELDCLFDFTTGLCADETAEEESSVYLHRLILRQDVGATFRGVFLLKQGEAIPIGGLISRRDQKRQLFYVADCVITEVATELSATEAIHSKVKFVTTGPIQLILDFPSGYLLKESGPPDRVLQETDFGILLEVAD